MVCSFPALLLDLSALQKKYLIAALILFFLLAGAMLWLASRPWEEKFFTPPTEIRPAITIEDSLVTFWQDGQKRGSFKADKIIVGKNDQKYFLVTVRDGQIFDKNKPIVTGFSAKNMTALPGQMDFQSKENISGQAIMDEETVAFSAGQVDYKDSSKEASLDQGFACSFSGTEISGRDILINLDRQTAASQSPFNLKKNNLNIKGRSFSAVFPVKTLTVTGPVQGEIIATSIKPGSKPLRTSLSFSSANFFWKDQKAVLSGNIKVVQAENTLLADEGEYNETDQTLRLTKNVRATTAKGQTKSSSALISLAEKNIQLEGQVQADLKIKIKR